MSHWIHRRRRGNHNAHAPFQPKETSWFTSWLSIQCTFLFNDKNNKEVDERISELFQYPIVDVVADNFSILVTNAIGQCLDIWIANKYYAYGTIRRPNNDRPSIKMMGQITQLEEIGQFTSLHDDMLVHTNHLWSCSNCESDVMNIQSTDIAVCKHCNRIGIMNNVIAVQPDKRFQVKMHELPSHIQLNEE